MNKINNSIFLFVVLAVPLVTGSLSSSTYVLADSLTGEKVTAGPTFTTKGTVNTLTGTNYTWLLGGNWNFQTINGIADSLSVDMTMIASNGTDRHHMLVTNFTQSENTAVNMTEDGNINVNGTSYIYGHGKLKWSSVPTQVSIDRFNVLHMFVDNNQTEDHFKGGIHGITNTFTYGFNFDSESAKLH
jgi:hypothetical protein